MTGSHFDDETADALFRTVLERPGDGLAKGVLADRLDEVGGRWKFFAHAVRWCGEEDRAPRPVVRPDDRETVTGYAWGCEPPSAVVGPVAAWMIPRPLWVCIDGRQSSDTVHEIGERATALFATPFEAYAALATAFGEAFQKLEEEWVHPHGWWTTPGGRVQ